jgi:hypothetical protein
LFDRVARGAAAQVAHDVVGGDASGSLKRPRAREIASSTFLRRMMRLPSSSTFSRVPLVRPSASRTALGRVICPRSATVASIVGSGKYA